MTSGICEGLPVWRGPVKDHDHIVAVFSGIGRCLPCCCFVAELLVVNLRLDRGYLRDGLGAEVQRLSISFPRHEVCRGGFRDYNHSETGVFE